MDVWVSATSRLEPRLISLLTVSSNNFSGPGASSAGYGNLMELGPCRIAPEGGYTIDNPHGWNTNATLIFVE